MADLQKQIAANNKQGGFSWGKLAGAAVGFVTGGPVGAAIGAGIGGAITD